VLAKSISIRLICKKKKNMLCCLDSFSDPKESYNRQTGDGVSDFPGKRRFVKTGGNALAQAPPNQTIHNGGGQLISVTVPDGVSPGQTIKVSSPDGKIVSAVVPSGVIPGSSFMVEFPGQSTPAPNSHGPTPSAVSISSPATEPGVQILTPPAATAPLQVSDQYSPQTTDKIVMVHVPPGVAPGSTLHVQVPGENRTIEAVVPPGVTQFHVKCPPSVVPVPPPEVVATPLPIPIPAPANSSTVGDIPFSMALDTPPPSSNYSSRGVSAPSNNYSPSQTIQATQHGQSMMKLQVPPGAAPGSTIHVQVPGEHRLIAAQVPHGGVSEFHVAYDPVTYNATATTTHTTAPPAVVSRPVTPAAPPGEQLILVQVPPGTSPGTTLHVQVPNEPGRLLSATVPPHVTEFHVSYRPQNGGSNPSSSSREQCGSRDSGYLNNNNSRGYQNNTRNGMNSGGGGGGGGFGTTAMSMLGGAAMGAVAMSIFDHAHHSGGDFGGGDFDGGDFGGDS